MNVEEANELERIARLDLRHHWHPFTRMQSFDPSMRMIVRASDCWVWDATGAKYLDAFAGLWSVNAGHNHPHIVEAIVRQARKLSTAPLFGSSHPTASQLAAEVATLCPGQLNRVFFSVQGSQAVETALKLSRLYWRSQGQSGKYRIIARDRAYHGTAMGGTSAQGIAANRSPFEPLLPGFSHIPAPLPRGCRLCQSACSIGCAELLADELEQLGPETVAAFIVEPVTGTGGVIPSPEGYLRRIRQICDHYQVLLIADEVMTGFGRTGRMFAIEHDEIEPDMLILSKGLTSGHLPLAATVIADRIFESVVGGSKSAGPEFPTGNTFDGYPSACAASLANLEVFESQGLVLRASELGEDLQLGLRTLESLPAVSEVRGQGMVAGIELEAPVSSSVGRTAAHSAAEVARMAFEAGVVVRPLVGDRVLAVAPPLTISKESIELIVEVLTKCIGSTAGVAAGP